MPNRKAAPDRSPSAPAPPVAPAPRTDAPRPAKTYTVRPGDALWPIAEEQLSPGTSTEAVARRVRRIAELNPDRFLSGDPNRLVAGEELRLP
jgi:Tfp pilus assembly protein FimV